MCRITESFRIVGLRHAFFTSFTADFFSGIYILLIYAGRELQDDHQKQVAELRSSHDAEMEACKKHRVETVGRL